MDALWTALGGLFIFFVGLWVIKIVVVFLEVGSAYGSVVIAFAIMIHALSTESLKS